MTRALVADKPVAIESAVDKSVPEMIMGDRNRLFQIMINLLGNAAKFTEAGSIAVSVSVPESASSKGCIKFEVRDTGPSVDAAYVPRMFQAFEQGSDHIKRRIEGSGLGLAISKGLVDLMHGHIGYTSLESGGSLFWVEIPMTVAEANVSPSLSLAEQDRQTDAGSKLKILVADDAAPSLLLIRVLLEGKGHSVTTVVNGHEAIEAARKEKFDLIILDLQMPLMGGIEAAQTISRESEDDEAPLIWALTAQAFEEDRRHALQAGMDDVLVKPLDISAFEKLLKHVTPRDRQKKSMKAHHADAE
jgi:CheY-like chemotaxis protein